MALVACALVVLAPMWSCLDPTEIDLRITTDESVASIAAPQQAKIFGGTPADVLTAPTIDVASNTVDTSGSFGDLVVAPKGDIGAQLALRVVLGVTVPTDQCDVSPQGCIVATRTISYVPHHEIVLPVELEAACLGKTCPSGYTCHAGNCVDDSVDTNLCDAGTCGPSALVDGSVLEAGTIDAPPESSTCDVANASLCGTNSCVDLTSDPANCGACGVDCTGGTCNNGTCQLTSVVAAPACLGLWNGSVYVADTQGALYTIPEKGGAAAPVSLSGDTVFDVTTFPGTDLAYSYQATSVWGADEKANGKTGMAVVGRADRIALDTAGLAWFDMQSGVLGYTAFASGNAIQYGTLPLTQASKAWLAAAAGVLYVSANGNELCRDLPNGPVCLSSNSTGIAVSDPGSSNPDVYVVDSATQILKYDSQLASPSVFATNGTAMAGLAWDNATSTAYAISDGAVYKSSAGTMTVLAKATSAVPRCIVVGENAVYWLESPGGVFKHAK